MFYDTITEFTGNMTTLTWYVATSIDAVPCMRNGTFSTIYKTESPVSLGLSNTPTWPPSGVAFGTPLYSILVVSQYYSHKSPLNRALTAPNS